MSDLPPPPAEPMSIDAPPMKTNDSTTNEGATSSSSGFLSNAEFLSRHEVLRRRSERVKKLAKIYRSHYWALMEELRAKYKEYYWMYGKSPYRDDGNGDGNGGGVKEEEEEEGKRREGGGGEEVKKCRVAGCKMKPMALTRFCHPHILSDSKQKLYTACTYVIKRY